MGVDRAGLHQVVVAGKQRIGDIERTEPLPGRREAGHGVEPDRHAANLGLVVMGVAGDRPAEPAD